MLIWKRHIEHGKHAHLGIFSMFNWWRCGEDTSNIKNMPKWTQFRCLDGRKLWKKSWKSEIEDMEVG